jgi:hypothetical protein
VLTTQLEYQPLALAFDASVHGWNNAAFHTQLDGQGATVLIMRTEGGAVCGGCVPATQQPCLTPRASGRVAVASPLVRALL